MIVSYRIVSMTKLDLLEIVTADRHISSLSHATNARTNATSACMIRDSGVVAPAGLGNR